MATNSGGWLYEANGTPADKATADNAQARVLEIKEDVSAAKSDAASALSAANSYAGQIAQANTTAGQAVAIATDAKGTAEAIEGPISTRLGYLETREGLAPGDVYDVETASVLAQPDSESNAALKDQIDDRRFLVEGSLGPASDLSKARIGFRTGNLNVAVAGDSTAAGLTDWPQQFAGMAAARCPWLRVVRKPWNNSTLSYDPDVVVQAGDGAPAFSGQVIHDTFTRTTGIANADDGGPWAVLNAANWNLNGSKATATGAASLSVDTGGRDVISTTVLDLNATGTGTNQPFRIYHGIGWGVFVELNVSAAGATTLFINRVNNSVATLIASPSMNVALGIPSNANAGQVTITITGEIQNYNVTVTYGSQTYSFDWTLPEAIYSAMVPGFALFPQAATPGIGISEATASVADSPATGQTLTILEAAMGGGTLDYQKTNWDAMFGREVYALRDTFTRTGAINGSTADTGEAWDGMAVWSANGSAAVPSGSGGVGVDLEGITEARATVEIITTIPASGTPETFRLGALTLNDGVTGLFLSVSITATGLASVTPYVRTPTGGYRQFTQMTGHGLPNNSATPQSVDMVVSFDPSTRMMTTVFGGLTVTNQITAAEASELGSFLELRSATAAAGSHFKVDAVEADYAPAGTTPLDIMVIAHGHNYGTRRGPEYIDILEDFLAFMDQRRPSTIPLISSQNPQFAPSANPAAHADRLLAARLYAMEHGISYAPVFERFAMQDDEGRSWVRSDGVHPNVTGYGEWANIVANLLV